MISAVGAKALPKNVISATHLVEDYIELYGRLGKSQTPRISGECSDILLKCLIGAFASRLEQLDDRGGKEKCGTFNLELLWSRLEFYASSSSSVLLSVSIGEAQEDDHEAYYPYLFRLHLTLLLYRHGTCRHTEKGIRP